MFKLPILTPESGRSLMTLAMMASGIACFAAALGLNLVVWLGAWTVVEEHTRLIILGASLAGYLIGAIFVQISMAVGGPLGRVKFSASRDGGVSVEASDDECEQKVATVTTEITVPAPSSEVL